MPFFAPAQRLRTHAALFLAGAAITLSFAPFRYWWVAPLACAVLALCLREATPQRAFFRGWSFGAGLFLAGTSWVYVSIHDYGYVPAVFAALLTIAFCVALGLLHAVAAWLYCRWLQGGRAGPELGFAAVWVAFEWLRSWLLTGFPWLYLGYGHIDTALAGWAPVTGVLGISFVVSFTGAALAAALATAQHRRWLPLAAGMGLVALGASLNLHHWTEPALAPPVRVAAVQTNITQDQKWLPDNYVPTLMRYRDMSLPLFPENDIVIWPEAAIPAFYHRAQPFLEDMADSARNNDSSLITGIPYWTGAGIYNSVIVLGDREERYFKRRLVPFGEYVPLERWLHGMMALFELPMSSFSAGPAGQGTLDVRGLRLAPFICYEIVYPDLVAAQARNANILLTISNDAWFGRSIGPAQHMQMARMRALENGRQLIRATGTGITALVDERGRFMARIPAFERGVLQGEVRRFTGTTPFGRWGSWPVVGLCLALIALSAFSRPRGN